MSKPKIIIIPEQQAQYDQEFSDLYGYAWTIASRKLSIEGPPDDDKLSDIIAFAWQGYARIRVRKPDVPTKLALRWALRRAIFAVRGGARFAFRKRKHRDAYGQPRTDMPPDVAAREYNGDPADRRAVDARIALLPEQLRTVAEYLSYGLPKTTVATLLGTSTRVVYERIAEIAKILAAVEPAAVETAPEPADDETPLPRGLRAYQPVVTPISAEHQPQEYPLVTRWRVTGETRWRRSKGRVSHMRTVHPSVVHADVVAVFAPPAESAPVREFRPTPWQPGNGRDGYLGTVTSTPDRATLVALLVSKVLARG